MSSESRLSESLDPYTGQYGAVVYELDSLSFMDVAGLRSLDTAPDIDAPITIRDPSRQVRRLLDLAGRESMIDEPASTHRTSQVGPALGSLPDRTEYRYGDEQGHWG